MLSLSGCPAKPPSEPPPYLAQATHAPPVSALANLTTSVGLTWMLLAKPAHLNSIDWLQPHLVRIFRDDRMNAFALTSGIDIRNANEILLASYDLETSAFFARHQGHGLEVERKFRQRLTGEVQRHTLGPQQVMVWGKVGRRSLAFANLGDDIAAFQYGGDPQRGPVRIALLYAAGRLTSVPRTLSEPTMAATHRRLPNTPLTLIAPGPFEGQLARGARGLLAGALAIGISLTPSAQRSLMLDIVLLGDFRSDRNDSQTLLLAAWMDLVSSDLGHLLGLHAPRTPPQVRVDPSALQLMVELEPKTLIDGLAAATVDSVREMMR